MTHPWTRDQLDEHISVVTGLLARSAVLLCQSEELLIIPQDQIFVSRLRLEQLTAIEERLSDPRARSG